MLIIGKPKISHYNTTYKKIQKYEILIIHTIKLMIYYKQVAENDYFLQ